MEPICDENGVHWTKDVELWLMVVVANHFAPEVISDEQWENIAARMNEQLDGLTDIKFSVEELR